jgi:8-oxo-dGTP pyrophosphatase MutT (NUDIX family)
MSSMRTADHLTIDIIRAALSTVDRDFIESPFPANFFKSAAKPAAVLIPLLLDEDHWKLLFIRRSANHNDAHSGQVAFPGGGMDPSDPNSVATALRETQEEIGIRPEDVKILGNLHRFITITGYCVTPVVGFISWPYTLELDPGEVSRAFTIPLAWLADKTNCVDKLRILPRPFKPVSVIYYKPYDNEILWGATARFTEALLKTLDLI